MGDSFTLEFKGLEKLAKELDLTVERVTESALVAIYGQGIALLELANRSGSVPVDSGALRASAYVTLPAMVSGVPTCEIGYGAEYAGDVHEQEFKTVSKGGFYRAGKGTPGWLRKAVNIHANAVELRLAESLRSALANKFKVATLVAVGIPTSPPDVSGGVGKYQRKYGFTKEQNKGLRGLKKNKAISFVRRWKRPKKKGK